MRSNTMQLLKIADDKSPKTVQLNGFIDGLCGHEYEPLSYGAEYSTLYINYRAGYLEGKANRQRQSITL